MNSFRRLFRSVFLCLVLALWAAPVVWAHGPVLAAPRSQESESAPPLVYLLTADGPLTPAMVEYLHRGLENAARQDAELLILELNTPGGSIDLMNSIVQDIRASSVPVAVYVAPSGSMAGSAGAIITLAAQVAAMAPGTTIGAASPVGSQGEDLGETMQAKEKNILKATVRSLAEGRSSGAIDLAEAMIESAQAVSATEALKVGLIDFIAVDENDLLKQLNGFEVTTAAGVQTLNTLDAEVREQTPSLIEQLLAVLTNPNIVFLLISVGVMAILVEMSSPGGWVAGFIGVICLGLAFYGLGVLDVNWFGALFLVIAFVLFILDIKAPTHGALTVAGVVSLIVAGLVLFNSPSLPAFQPRISIVFVVLMSILTGAMFFGALMIAMRAQKVPIQVGVENLVGRTGRALTAIRVNQRGQVQVASERWTAELEAGETDVPAGTEVVVSQVQGLRLVVRKAS